MVQVNYSIIPNEFFINYFDFLISKVFKCLPMKENNEITLSTYMESLLRELIGNKELIIELKGSPIFLSLLGKIEYLIQNEVDMKTYKKDIFDCITLIEKLKKEVINIE